MSRPPRVVSLLPGASDWLAAFGAADLVVGRTHLCDAPEVASTPVVTRPAVELGTAAPEIDDAVRRAVQDGLSPFALDLDALRSLRPDLVVTQAVCGVCAPPLADVEKALDTLAGGDVELVNFAPGTYKQVLDAALDLGRRVGRLPDAMRVVADGEARLRRLADRVGGRRQLGAAPRVVCVEWVEPVFTAGHWTPDLVEHAGGVPVLSEAGARSGEVTWGAIADADPDVLVVAACGRSVAASVADLEACAPRWRDLRAAREGCAVVLEGDLLFNRPGPSLVRSSEVMAWAIWGEASGITPRPEEAAVVPAVSA